MHADRQWAAVVEEVSAEREAIEQSPGEVPGVASVVMIADDLCRGRGR